MNLGHLYEFCTVRQLEVLQAVEAAGSNKKAAAVLGLGRRVVDKTIVAIKHKAAQRLPSMHDYTKSVPEGYAVRGVSQYIDADSGKIRGTWVKTSQDDVKRDEMMREAVSAMCEEITPQKPIQAPLSTYGNLCNVYTITDAHVGMLASDVDTKSGSWDLKIAEQTLVGCFSQMVESAPAAGTCVIAQLGDYVHYSSALSAVTELHGHALDADGRMYKMVKVAIRILRRVIDLALKKHEKVVLLIAEGNHDISASVWLRAMFQTLYENESRIQVIDSELPYYVYQHGNTMLCWHHGHLVKSNDQLPMIFAAQFPTIFGATSKRVIHVGHRHHTHIKELTGFTVEQHPTLAARDAYAARGGWIAERQVTAITYSDKFGQVARNTVTPEMLAGSL
jgi:hypothetical protein